MPAIVSKGLRKSERGVMLLGVDLRDAKEEAFVRMVCDGLSLGVAFSRAGFTSKARDAPSNLFHLPRVQERAAAILEARRTTGVVSLGEVTSMLQRVFAGAHAAEEFSAAHNAAFSLARLYGHVTDKATLEVIRRPSRDPDAPSEQALSSWVEALPALPGPGPAAFGEASFARVSEGPEASPASADSAEGPNSARDSAPAPLLGEGLEAREKFSNDFNEVPGLEGSRPSPQAGPQGEFSNDFNWLKAAGPEGPGPESEFLNEIKGLDVAGRPENGAPSRAVTGTPNQRAHTKVLVQGADKVPPPPGATKKRVPLKRRRVTALIRVRAAARKKRVKSGKALPSAKDLFG